MTDDLDPTPEELALQEAKEAAAIPPEPIPDAEGLPDDVKDGEVIQKDPDDPWPDPGYLTPEPDPTGHVDHGVGE